MFFVNVAVRYMNDDNGFRGTNKGTKTSIKPLHSTHYNSKHSTATHAQPLSMHTTWGK